MSMQLRITSHDEPPPAAARTIDAGLGADNERAAPLHEVRPLACLARIADDADGAAVIGGAIGRTWGACFELQQLWVAPAFRRAGVGSRLVEAFEARAWSRGCRIGYLETFSFQAPRLYAALGYRIAYEHRVYPHGIVRFLMTHELSAAAAAGCGDDVLFEARVSDTGAD